MLVVVSPAKSLDFETPSPVQTYTLPQLLSESEALVTTARQLNRSDVMRLMHVSEKIADLNVMRFAEWSLPFTPNNSKTAIHAFTGDVYQGMQPLAWSAEELSFAQQHIRILSGLYGVLRPLDLMQAYRLEMGCGLQHADSKNLYAFWQDLIAKNLHETLEASRFDTLLNLASEEYFKAVDTTKIKANIVHITFKEDRKGTLKVISFNAKRARGKMADFIVRNRIAQVSDLKAFVGDGYVYNPALSTKNHFTFTK